MFSSYTILALFTLALVAQAQPPYIYSGQHPQLPGAYLGPLYDPKFPFNTPGPVIPQDLDDDDFAFSDIPKPFDRLSSNYKEVASIVSQKKLGGFCNQLLNNDNDDQSDTEGDIEDEGNSGPLFDGSSNADLNLNYNSNTGPGSRSGSSYSSSYSNSNGRITGIVSGYPGPGGKPYSYHYGNIPSDQTQESQGSNSYSYSNVNYIINGVSVPKALQGYTPKAIKKGCEKALRGGPRLESTQKLAAGGLNPRQVNKPRYAYQNVYYGTGTDLPIRAIETPGIPPVRYTKGRFTAYRKACGRACFAAPQCAGFVVATDFNLNVCKFVGQRHRLSRADFIDESEGAAPDDTFHVEGYRKIRTGSKGEENQE